MKRVLFIILMVMGVFLVVVLAMTGMARQRGGVFLNGSSPAFGYGGGGAPAEAPPMPAADSFAREESVMQAIDVDEAQQTQERLVIKNADLGIVVKDPEAYALEISALANELGGYVVSSGVSKSSSGERSIPSGYVTIRVPSEKLDQALETIKKGALDVQYENRSGQDVTDQYIDLEAQLKAKEAAEEKLLEIMDQATRAEDVLAVYVQLQQIQSEIEVLRGRIKYLEESVALSSINVQLIDEESLPPLEVGGWRLGTTASQALQDLQDFVQGFARLLIQLVILVLPAALLIGLTGYLIFLAARAIYRRFNRSGRAAEEIKG